jgi:YHS domain-containing protein
MKRLLSLGLTLGVLTLGLHALAADSSGTAALKEKLQALQEFIGKWNGNGGPEKAKATAKELWTETLSWGWKFKGDDVALALSIKDGKYYKGGDLRWLPAKKVYEFTAISADDKKLVFEGTVKKDALTLERVDPTSKETQQIIMNTAAEGDRFIFRYNHKPASSTLFKKDYLVQATRDGVSLGKVDSKNECVVSGGKGTMTVSYKGETFYVCCSGCADAFKENPEKYIAEFKAKKNKK